MALVKITESFAQQLEKRSPNIRANPKIEIADDGIADADGIREFRRLLADEKQLLEEKLADDQKKISTLRELKAALTEQKQNMDAIDDTNQRRKELRIMGSMIASKIKFLENRLGIDVGSLGDDPAYEDERKRLQGGQV